MSCDDIYKIPVIKGDARVLFQINQPTLPTGWTLTKMNVQIGPILKSYTSPTFPYSVSLTSTETLTLNTGVNEVNILFFNGTEPKTAVLDKVLQVFGVPQKVQQ